MSENKSLFREKSMEQFSSPEQLNDYIRVTNPSLMVALVGVICLLAGLLIWGLLGNIDAYAEVNAQVESGKVSAYISSADATQLNENSTITISGSTYSIDAISAPMRAGDALDGDQINSYGLDANAIVVAVNAEAPLSDGFYPATVVMKHLKPIELILR